MKRVLDSHWHLVPLFVSLGAMVFVLGAAFQSDILKAAKLISENWPPINRPEIVSLLVGPVLAYLFWRGLCGLK